MDGELDVLEPERRGPRVAAVATIMPVVAVVLIVLMGRRAPHDLPVIVIWWAGIAVVVDTVLVTQWYLGSRSPLVVRDGSLTWLRQSSGGPPPPSVLVADVDHAVLSRYAVRTARTSTWGLQLELVGADAGALARWRLRRLFDESRLDGFLRRHGLRVEVR